MSESKTKPKLKQVLMLNEHETIMQIIQFGNTSIACLTSTSRVLIPGSNFGEWFALPVPPSFSSTEH